MGILAVNLKGVASGESRAAFRAANLGTVRPRGIVRLFTAFPICGIGSVDYLDMPFKGVGVRSRLAAIRTCQNVGFYLGNLSTKCMLERR